MRVLTILALWLAASAAPALASSPFASAGDYKRLSREFEGRNFYEVRRVLLGRGYRPLRLAHPNDLSNSFCGDGYCKRFPETLNCYPMLRLEHCDYVYLSPAHKLVDVEIAEKRFTTVVKIGQPEMAWLRRHGYPKSLEAGPTVSEKLYRRLHGRAYAGARSELLRLGFRPVHLNDPPAHEPAFCPDGLCRRYPELLECWTQPECDFVFMSPAHELIDIVTSGRRRRVIDVLEPDVPNGIRLGFLRERGYRPKSPDDLCEPGEPWCGR